MYLEVAVLRHKPVIDELLRSLGEAEKEVALNLELVDRVHCLVYLNNHYSLS